MSIGITDHALVRWLDRTGAMDVEAIRAMLGASLERSARAAATLGQTRYLILADGMVYVVQDAKLITVMHDDGRHHQAQALLRT